MQDPFFFQWQDRRLGLVRGVRPDLLSNSRPVTRRQLAAYKNHVARIFPVDEARRYQAELGRPGIRTKVQAAQRLGVSYVRFVQTLTLLNLDPRVLEFLDANRADPVVAATFSERRLRDLLTTTEGDKQWRRFQEILEQERSQPGVWTSPAEERAAKD